MRAVIQRVKTAKVVVEGESVGAIGHGLLVLFGVKEGDEPTKTAWMARKIANMRCFLDPEGRMNLSVKDVGGEVLVVSQFTLYGDCQKGNRPSFIEALGGEEAEKIYDQFVEDIRRELGGVQTGIFGAKMDVSLVNDGPVTLLLDK